MKVHGRTIDPWLTLFAVLLTVLGCVAIFDAGFARSTQSGSWIPPEFRAQIAFSVIAVIAGMGAALVPIEKWKRAALPMLGIGFLLLVLVKIIGIEMNGAQRWIKLGPITIQAAEFMKVAMILFLAWLLPQRKDWKRPKRKLRDFADKLDYVVLPRLARYWPLLVVGLAVVLIEREPDLGTAAVVAATAFFMFVYAGVSRFSLVAVTLGSLLFTGVFLSQETYRMERITSHLHRWEDRHMDDIGYQTTQSETAMADGGLFGQGIGAGRVKHYMPAATTDFIFATIAEETGLFGVTILVALTAAMVVRMIQLAGRSQSPFGQLVAVGVALWMTVQAATNLMMANGALPPIGIPYPLISSGGSSLIAIWVGIGMTLSAGAKTAPDQLEDAVEDRGYRWGHGRTRPSRA